MTAAKTEYEVARMTPAAARADLLRVWRDNLEVVGPVEAKYRWLYADAPDRPAVVLVLSAHAAGDAPVVVGSAGVGIRRFHAGGGDVRAALLADLAVDRAHRQLLPALRLVRAAKALAESDFAFAYGFPNRLAEGVFKRAGYAELGRIVRYARVLRHADYADRVATLANVPEVVKRAVALPGVAQVAGVVADAGRLALGAPLAVRAVTSFRLAWADGFDDRFDLLWRAARGAYRVVGERSAEILRWRYLGPDRRIATLLARSDRSLRAYAILEREGGAACVRDLFGHPADLGPLLDLLIPALYKDGASSMSMRFLGAGRTVDLLQSRGFVARQKDRMIAVAAGAPGGLAPALLAEVDAWHLCDFDEDV
jgi:hypothetical protein